jgi:phosphoribosyl 1,2-cyclic phosphodiesterase
MALSFSVLASGSAGNASLLLADDIGLLIDVGIGPRVLAHRLHSLGLTWKVVKAVLLTHTHSDHWTVQNLAHLKRHGIPLWCHAEHHGWLRTAASFAALEKHGLLRNYEADREFAPLAGLKCVPLPLRHDGGATFGFRIESGGDLFGNGGSLAYAADLGSWDEELAAALAEAELLALEFNHDVAMQLDSGRHPQLIERVLGEEGHLSNDQAAELVQAILARSTPGRLKNLVQLHLSRQCNTPELALRAARRVVHESVSVHAARQERPMPLIPL